MKKGVTYILLFLIVILATGLYIAKEDVIHRFVTSIKWEYKNYTDSIRLHDDDVLIEKVPILNKGDSKWYSRYHVIAHGGGGINGYKITNTLEALNEHYIHGTRLFDVDIVYTKDGIMVLCHGWNDYMIQTALQRARSKKKYDSNLYCHYSITGASAIDLKTFKSHLVLGNMHPITLEEALDWLESHPDAYLMPDLKNDVINQLKEIVDLSGRREGQDLLQRIIVRIEDYGLYDNVIRVFPIRDNIMLKRLSTSNDSYYDILSFCVKHSVHCVSLSSKDANSEIIKEFKKRGVRVFVAVVNDCIDYRHYQKLGAWGVVSDFLYEKDLN